MEPSAAPIPLQFDEGVKYYPGLHLLISLFVLIAAVSSYHLLEKQRTSRNWIAHVVYFGVATATIVFLPFRFSNYLFSSLTESLLGVAIPIYESVRAVCTPDDEDDLVWLQYWIAGGSFFMFSTWVDDAIRSDVNTEYWYECTLFIFFWLYFPLTSGATLIYDTITKPYFAPRLKPLATRMDNAIEFLIQTLVNASHLMILWVIFIILPKGLKRMVTIAVGTIYPLVSSVTAASTGDLEDITYWLTYWSVYGILFFIMDILYVPPEHKTDSFSSHFLTVKRTLGGFQDSTVSSSLRLFISCFPCFKVPTRCFEESWCLWLVSKSYSCFVTPLTSRSPCSRL